MQCNICVVVIGAVVYFMLQIGRISWPNARSCWFCWIGIAVVCWLEVGREGRLHLVSILFELILFHYYALQERKYKI